MNASLKKLLALAISFGLVLIAAGCQPRSDQFTGTKQDTIPEDSGPAWTPDQEEVKATVEHFLTVAGNFDLEAMDQMISDKANLGIGRLKEGTWETSVITIGEYFDASRNHEPIPYYEPVSDYIIHVNEGQIAMVWADATLFRFGIPRSHNIDNFTLLRENGQWIFLNLSFTSRPFPLEEMQFDPGIFAKSYALAWSSKRPEFVALYFAENGTLSVNDGEPAIGRDQIVEVARGFMTAFPDMVVSFDSLVSWPDGDAFYWTMTATNSGPGGNGNKIKLSGYELWQLGEEGLIHESQGHFSAEEYNRQLETGTDQ